MQVLLSVNLCVFLGCAVRLLTILDISVKHHAIGVWSFAVGDKTIIDDCGKKNRGVINSLQKDKYMW